MSDIGLQEESGFFREHVAEWSKDKELYRKWALIKGRKLIGVFDGFNEAVAKGFELFGLELFLVSEIDPDMTMVTTTESMLAGFLSDS